MDTSPTTTSTAATTTAAAATPLPTTTTVTRPTTAGTAESCCAAESESVALVELDTGEKKAKKQKKVKKSALARKVGYFILYVTDMEKAVEFYKTIGLKPGYQSPEWSEFKAGIKVALHLTEGGCCCGGTAAGATETAEKHGKYTGLVFAVKNVDKTRAAFERLGVKVLGEPVQVCEEGRSLEFEDPFGNVLSVYGK